MNIIVRQLNTENRIIEMQDAKSNPFKLSDIIQLDADGKKWKLVSEKKNVMMQQGNRASEKGVWIEYGAILVEY